MCGICCIASISCKSDNNIECQAFLENSIRPSLSRRGPDYSKCLTIPIRLGVGSHLRVCACTLRMRGSPIVDDADAQPVTNSAGQTLLWNGEVFAGHDVGETECDTNVLFEALTASRLDDEVLATIKSIKGPYSFVYIDGDSLWFGRDYFGRRSLLWSQRVRRDGSRSFMLSSVADVVEPDCEREIAWQEVPAKGLFKLYLRWLYCRQ